jgi:glycosyltransferase involved in cell wall biosynthesis
MARILILGPQPPAPTGVATYLRSVLAQLDEAGFSRTHRVEAPWPLPGDVEAMVEEADLTVYQVGNNIEFHGDIYRLAVRHPGIVVLHDLAVDDLVRRWVEEGSRLGEAIRRDAIAAAGALGRPQDLDEPLRVPWCAHLVRRARGVIVHSPFGREYLKRFGCLTPAFVAPHPAFPDVWEGPSGRAVRRLRRRLRGTPGTVVGVLGDLGPSKGIEAVLEAVKRIPEPVHLALVGRSIPFYSAGDTVRAAGLEGRVTIAPDVPDEDFLAWLSGCQVIVNLRFPHRGEVSGTVIRALQAGRATVVSGAGTYLDWPEDAVVRVSPGPPRVDELAEAIGSLVRDPARRRAVGERARTHLVEMERQRLTARGYVEAVERTLSLLRDPARRAAERWARALADAGATEDSVRKGFGLSYVDALHELAPTRPAGEP